jgi:chromosome segregation protein
MDALLHEREGVAAIAQELSDRAEALNAEVETASTPDAHVLALEELDRKLSSLREELRQADSDAAREAARLLEAEGRIGAAEALLTRLQMELQSTEGTRRQLLGELTSWAAQYATTRHRWQELIVASERDQRLLDEASRALGQAAEDVSRREGELRRAEGELAGIEMRLDAAQAAEVELPAPDAAIRALFGAAGKTEADVPPENRLYGLVGMLGELLRVPSGLERAIEAALADALHGVVVETQEDALAAAELLITEDLGRATIFPLSDIRTSPPLNILDERGVIGVAADLVRCEGRYKRLVDALLGRTIVVENVGVGKAVLRRGLGAVVTRDGVLLHPTGSISAGSSKPIRAAISRRRDAGELPALHAEGKRAHERAEAELANATNRLAEAQSARQQAAAQAAQALQQQEEAERTVQQQRTLLQSMSARLAALHARRDGTSVAIAAAEIELAQAREEIRPGQPAKEATESKRNDLQAELDQQLMQRETLVRRTAERSTHIAALEEERTTLDRQRTQQAESLARIDSGITRRQELLASAQEEAATIGARLDATRTELQEKSDEAATAARELEPARNEVEQIESRQRTLAEELTGARARSLEAERALLEAESNLTLRREELQALRERLAEEGFRPTAEGTILPLAEDEPQEATPPVWMTATTGDGPDLPPMRGGSEVETATLKERVHELRTQIRRLGPVNEQAGEDFTESRERHAFLTTQLGDLREAEGSLLGAIDELEHIIKERFSVTFQQVNTQFMHYFTTFFQGGHGELELTEPDEYGLPGVEVIAQPPRKKVRSLNMLSGGERSLTALALLFALLEANPSPICVLDEVDAALDEANVDRFTGALQELAKRTQFIIITHNRRTLEMATTIYGVSMGADSTSSILSLRLADIAKN